MSDDSNVIDLAEHREWSQVKKAYRVVWEQAGSKPEEKWENLTEPQRLNWKRLFRREWQRPR